ncbi:MAG: hypothetical protein ACI9R6_000527 [Saprospiraceae bacterium]|jgi:hypothetical protein
MHQKYFIIICFLSVGAMFAQEEIASDSLDSKYREDQFYIGMTYNVLMDTPETVQSRGLTGSVHFGYLRDMPINMRRNVAVAIGVGASFDEYGTTLFIGENEAEQTIFTSLDASDVAYESNRFSTASIEVPIEFRWRSSRAETYKFWRVYGGLRFGYAYWYKASFKQDNNNIVQANIPEFNKMRIGATLSFGYNTINFYGYYGINPFFENAITSNGTSIGMSTLKLGLLFFIL